jgi:hypothetical protein
MGISNCERAGRNSNFDKVDPKSEIGSEEFFGPAMCLMTSRVP